MAEPDDDPANPGGFIVTVAIADVAAYVRPGSASTARRWSAATRSISPTASCRCCRSGSPTTSARCARARTARRSRSGWWSPPTGAKRRHSFHRVMMRSRAKLSYAQAQAAIDGQAGRRDRRRCSTRCCARSGPPTRRLREARDSRGPLALDLPERKVLLTPEGAVDRVIVPERLDAHRLIEEFMIQANVAAAETLEAAKPGADLPRARRAGAREDAGARRGPGLGRRSSCPRRARCAPRCSTASCGSVAEHASTRTFINEVVLRTPGAGRLRVRESRPFRPEPAPLRAFHLADPALRRPDRPPGADHAPAGSARTGCPRT